MTTKPLRRGKLAQCLAILTLAAACGGGQGRALTPSVPPASPPSSAGGATPTPPPMGPTSDSSLPVDQGPFPLDLVVFDAGNLDRLAPFRELSAESLPDSISSASLAFFPSYEYQLAAHLDDGQLIVWNMAGGAVSYRDWHASADSHAGQHPPLAISPSYQRYLATSESIHAEDGPETASGTVLRTPDESQESWLLSGARIQPGWTDRGVHVMGIAFSPDGHLLAASLGDEQGGWVQIWDIWEQTESRLIQEIGFDEPASDVRFTPDGSALVCATGDTLVYLDPNSGSELQRRSFGFPILGLALGPGGDTLAVWGEDRAVLESPALSVTLDIVAFERIRRVEFLPDERLAVVADGDSLRFWDLSAGVELTTHLTHLGASDFLDVRILDNGRVLATIDSQARVALWGVRGGFELPQALARISAGNAASLNRAASLYIPGISETHISPNSDWLAVGSPQGIYLVDLPTLQLRQLLPLVDREYSVFDASANGRWLAWVAADGLVEIWDL
ncbi:MAG TPA: WD40 repeat domain-containing protein, partial [Anaerolineales bacterium]